MPYNSLIEPASWVPVAGDGPAKRAMLRDEIFLRGMIDYKVSLELFTVAFYKMEILFLIRWIPFCRDRIISHN